MQKFVLIIPTHERHDYLSRSMQYYSSLKFKVIYCDSSKEAFKGVIPPNIEYIYCPDKKFGEKVLFTLNSINTKFVALCPDDDFTSKKSLNKGLNFLENNNTFKTVLGKTIGFNKNFSDEFFNITRKELIDINNDNPSKRVETFFKNYHNTLWGLYDVTILKNAFEIIKEAQFSNDNFIELVIATLSSYTGKIKELSDVWSVREISEEEHWGKRHNSLSNCYTKPEIIKDLETFKKYIDSKTNVGIGELAINSYFKGFSTKKQSSIKKLKKSILNIIPIQFKKYIAKVKSKEIIPVAGNTDLTEISIIILKNN